MWEAHGYRGSGNVEGLIDSLQGRTAIVVGNGETFLDDLENAPGKNEAVIFAVNDVGMYLPTVHHWASLHGDKLKAWHQVRAVDWPTEPWACHSDNPVYGCQYSWQLEPCFSLSGYFAMQISYLMGAERIILCGCPGDASLRFFDRIPRIDFDYQRAGTREQLEKEMARLPEFKAKVRSMGGFTAEFFGRP